MSNVVITIDNKKIEAKEQETILEVARREGIYIPTMCYLSKVSPIASCRLCVVKDNKTGDMILSCQEKVVDKLDITTNSKELFVQRQNIMKLYSVNHPLECGVCDKSGECDLQNKTLEFEVNNQTFSAKEQKRDIQNWGLISYDPSLCILCEKCVSVCNVITGEDSLQIQYGGYSSSIIKKEQPYMDECSQCGECMSVCPVGALIDSDFKYTSNAWELEKIPAINPHYSDGALIYYEVKQTSCDNNSRSIYRVTNDFEFDFIPGSIRFGFDFENRAQKSKSSLIEAVKAFKKAKAIRFNSYITNEEAYILQQIKEKFGIKLINKDAKQFQEFLSAYSEISSKMLYNATTKDIKNSNFTIIVGSKITTDNPYLKNVINISSKRNRADIIYMHPIEDSLLSTIANCQIRYEVGTEEGVLAILVYCLLDKSKTNSKIKEYIDNLDLGYISSETNISDNDISTIKQLSLKHNNKTLIIGADIISNKKRANIARLCALIERYAGFKVMIIPTSTNTLGVSLICDLDNEIDDNSFVVGYNEKGDFVLSSFGDGDLDMPSLNQQEGTFTSMNKMVVPTNVAVSFKGYFLNDIANKLGIISDNTIDYTDKLPIKKGYKSIKFDDLGIIEGKIRGYILENIDTKEIFALEDIKDLPEFNGHVIYRCEPIMQVNYNTYKSSRLKDEAVIKGSNQFSIAAKIENNDLIEVDFGNFKIKRRFVVDKFLKGTIALNPTFDFDLDSRYLLSEYRYKQVQIKKVVE